MRVSRLRSIALCAALLTLILWSCAAPVTVPPEQPTASPPLEAIPSIATVATPARRLTPVAPPTPGVPVASPASAEDGPRVTILYTNDGRGKIDPCG